MLSPATATEPDRLDIDRLDVYRVAVEFATTASRLRVTPASLRDQLERAAASVVLNVAEGAGRAAGADRSHFYAIARGSAFECAAVLDVLHARGVLAAALHRDGRALLVRIAQMTSRLMGRPTGVARRQRPTP
jgi:four helix bundle protein